MFKHLIVIIIINLSLLIFFLIVQSFLKKRFTYLIFKILLYLIKLFLFYLKIKSNLLLLLLGYYPIAFLKKKKPINLAKCNYKIYDKEILAII